MNLTKVNREVFRMDPMDLSDSDDVALTRARLTAFALADKHPHIRSSVESGEYPALTDDQIFELDRALRGVA